VAGRLASAMRTRWPSIPDILDAFRAASTLIDQMARRRRGGAVLLYHRIAPSAGDPSTELVPAVSVSTFRRQMRWLRLFFRAVPARTLPAAITDRRVWQRFPIAVTFDDENPEHVEWALPILRETQVGATFFLTGLCLDGPQATWWELLQGAVDADLPLDRLLGGGDIHSRAERVKLMQPQQRDGLVRALERMGARAPNRAMTPEELIAVATEHDVGFHTLRHDYLPVLPPQDLNRALNEGRETLEEALGRRIDLIAYPHGGAGRREAVAARRAGYRLGFTTAPRGWSPTMDPLRIGRIEAGEERVGSVARRLADVLVRTG
jgi:peptidoglycan/xylan/chitin deacetylase (PgdA/CDA1 family)